MREGLNTYENMGWTVSNHIILAWHTEFCEYLGYNVFSELVKLGNLLWLQSGHNIEKVREKIRELTRLLCHIYPPSKVFAYVVEGLRSKNNRTRVECVDAIGYMVEEYGIEVIPTCCLDAFHFYLPLGAKNCFQ
jgi:hypothetical protein